MFFVISIIHKYGRRTGALTKKLLKTSIKLAKTKNRLKFLLNCRKCKLLPRCLDYRINLTLYNPISKRELENLVHRQKIRIISVFIKDVKRTIVDLKKQKQHLHHRIQEHMDRNDWNRTQDLIEKSAAKTYNATKRTEIRKLDNLKTKKIHQLNTDPDWIENTTNITIPDYLNRTLLLGPNFNIQSKTKIPYVRFISDIENAIKAKPEADEIRTEMTNIVNNYINYQKQPSTKENNWIQKDIVHSQKFLKDNPDLYITKADKGNKTVLLTATEYHQKMTELVNDTTTYKPISQNLTTKTLKKLNTTIDYWEKEGYIDVATKKKLKMYNCYPPRIYGLPKTHKENRPLRPVVSTVGSATYRIAQYFSDILTNTVGKTEHHIRNSFEFGEDIGNVRVPEGHIMYSLDVVSLYTNIPLSKVYECVEERWHDIQKYTNIPWNSFKDTMNTILNASFFQYNSQYYMQTEGVPMGSPLSPVVANIVMEKLENICLNDLKTKGINISFYRRYVDDCFLLGKEEDLDTVLTTFNAWHPSLKFTCEKEKERKMRFLDVDITRNDQKLEKIWFPKQENGRYLDFTSESPYSHKVNTACTLIDRALKLTDIQYRPRSINMVKNILQRNNYPITFINLMLKKRVHKLFNTLQTDNTDERGNTYASITYIPNLSEKVQKVLKRYNVTAAHQTTSKIKSIIHTRLKDKIPLTQQRNLIYAVPCGACPDQQRKIYVGQTSQPLEKRLSQHKYSIKTGLGITGLSQHTIDNGHTFDFAGTRVLEKIDNDMKRQTAEMLHIKLRGTHAVNLQRETMDFSRVYDGVIGKLKTLYVENINRTASTTAIT